ncbi:MAG: hypothetical protein Q8K70_07305 [Bacteroidota bacterium]|nr:hypothetical protein [Bacteroidota bacterium]
MTKNQNLLFSIVIALLLTTTSCKKEETQKKDEPTPVLQINLASSPTFKAKVNGTELTWIGNLTSNMYSGTIESRSGDDLSLGSYISDLDETKGFAFQIGEILDFGGTLNEIKGLLSKKSYPFSMDAQNGVSISFQHTDGKTYNSSNSPNISQVGTFEIIDISYSDDIYEISGKVYARFNVTLYDENGNSIKLENGEYVGYFKVDV